MHFQSLQSAVHIHLLYLHLSGKSFSHKLIRCYVRVCVSVCVCVLPNPVCHRCNCWRHQVFPSSYTPRIPPFAPSLPCPSSLSHLSIPRFLLLSFMHTPEAGDMPWEQRCLFPKCQTSKWAGGENTFERDCVTPLPAGRMCVKERERENLLTGHGSTLPVTQSLQSILQRNKSASR